VPVAAVGEIGRVGGSAGKSRRGAPAPGRCVMLCVSPAPRPPHDAAAELRDQPASSPPPAAAAKSTGLLAPSTALTTRTVLSTPPQSAAVSPGILLQFLGQRAAM